MSATIIVYAAGSLVDAFGEIERQFEAENPGLPVHLTFASADHLRERLRQGEQADVFAPANREEMDNLAAAGLVVPPVRIFATNRLAIVVSRANPVYPREANR